MIRVVFAGNTALDDVNQVLRSISAQVVAGPSEAGVYTLGLAADATKSSDVDQAIAQLRADLNRSNARAGVTQKPLAATTTADAKKERDRSKDARCIPNEGPIPVECRAASCGTCWVGVLGGMEKLSPVEKHEAVRMKVFGYTEIREGTQPVLRLACQAKAMGAVSIVIPPWNGMFGRATADRRP